MAPDTLFSLRPATQTDFPAIRSLIHQVGINPLGLGWRHFVIAVDAGARMVGCGQVKHHRDGSLELASIATQPERRKQGVATAIILRLLQAHPRPLYLTCGERLGPFYGKFGFMDVSDARDLPPYFRRLSRLGKLLQRMGVFHERLLVMRLEN